MNKLTIVFMFFFLSNCTKNENKIKQVEISSVDFNIMTRRRIESNNFESAFSDQIKFRVITDSIKLIQFTSILQSLKIDSLNKIPDVRARILITFTKNTVDSLYMGRFSLLYNKQSKIGVEQLVNFVNEN